MFDYVNSDKIKFAENEVTLQLIFNHTHRSIIFRKIKLLSAADGVTVHQ